MQEIIGITIILGFMYLSPSLLLSCFVAIYIKELSKNIKLIAAACLLVPTFLQISLLYKANISLIYQGAEIMAQTYVMVFFIAALILKIKPTEAKL